MGFTTIHQQIKNKVIPADIQISCLKWKPVIVTRDSEKKDLISFSKSPA